MNGRVGNEESSNRIPKTNTEQTGWTSTHKDCRSNKKFMVAKSSSLCNCLRQKSGTEANEYEK